MRKFYSVAIVMLALFSFGTIKAQEVNEKSVQDLVKTNAAQLHISQADAGNAAVNSYFTDPGTGLLYTYIQQTWKGIKVYNVIITAAFRDNKLVYTSGKFVNDIATKAVQSVPSLAAAQAVAKSAEHLQLPTPSNLQTVEDKFIADKKIILSAAGIAKQNITAELFWVADDNLQNVKLAWNVNIDVAGSSDWWNVRIDAINGNYIEKDNWTVHENNHGSPASANTAKTGSGLISPLTGGIDPLPTSVTNAAYRVVRFPGESPSSGTMGIDNEPWLKAGSGNNATTHGWHYDGVNDYSITRGNNVFAYLDILATNNAGTTNCPDTSSSVIPTLTFTNTPTFTDPPSTTINRKFAIDNLFYWNNLMHDVMYQYGFNEVSGNFQADNLGRGGSGGDFVRAEGQDASGTNNANFATPADGGSGRMQMFLFSPVPGLTVNSPASIAGMYPAVESGFSTNNQLINTGPVTGQVVYYEDGGGTHEACGGPPGNSLTGKIALIIRGNCNFTVKVKNAQDAGAIGVIMVNNVAGDPITMGGTDNTITIPAVMVSQADGAVFATQLANNLNVTLSAGVNRDGDLDNGVVCHEYGHGISNRLTGGRTNASCLANAEQGGEGWSDFLALMMVTNWTTAQLTDGNLPRPMGTYVLGQGVNGSGIRIYPYTLNMTLNPHTYADLINVSSEAHDIGEVWASALWDMTWNIIAQEGSIEPNIYNSSSNGGNAIALRLVMEGMRLQTCRPGFLDARNAILAADSILYNYRHKCSIWNAFARRGMGYSAVQGSSNSATDQVAAFDVPSVVTLTKSAAPQVIDQNTQVTINLSASCNCQATTNNIIRDTIPAGFSYVSSTGGTLSGNIVTFSPVSFSAAMETKNFSITLQASGSSCSVDTAINDNRDGAIVGGLTPNAISGVILWTPSNVRSSSPSNSWFASNSATTTDFTLTSNAFTAGNLSVLSFKHYYVMENSVDGGRVEISNDNGTTWTDAGPFMVQNKYNTIMNATSPWGNNEKAFSGVSYGQGSDQFIRTIVDLSSFAGQSIRVRFRMRTNGANASNSTYEGWFVDDILHMNGCGGMVKAGIYNSTGTLIDNSANPVFVKGNGTTGVTFTSQPTDASACENSNASFTVVASGTPAPTYKWQVSTDGGATFSDIPGQTSSTLTIPVTTAMNGYKYRSIADNGIGTAISAAVTLTVNQLVNVTTQPANTSVCGGTNASFSVAGTGSGTLTYKWQVSTDGGTTFTDIPGQTTATLTFATANNMDGSKYRGVVTGTCGPATSNAATLTVKQQAIVNITSLPGRICTSDTVIALQATPAGGVWTGTGVNGNTFVPASTAPGNYTLTYTYANASGCVSVGTAAAKLEDCPERKVLLSANAIILYPNPNNGQFHIKMNSTLYSSLGMKVYASNGALVRTQQLSGLSFGARADINLSNLAAAVYMVKFYHTDATGTVEKTFKVVIAGH